MLSMPARASTCDSSRPAGPAPMMTTGMCMSRSRRSDRVVPRAGLNGDPTLVGEFRDGGFPTEAPIARGLHTAKGHLRFVVHRRPIDVTDSGLNALRHSHRTRNVATEDSGR